MNAQQQRLSAAILANLRAGVCTAAVMATKAAEYRRNAARDLSIAADIAKQSHPGAAEAAERFRKSAASQERNAEATITAVAAYCSAGAKLGVL